MVPPVQFYYPTTTPISVFWYRCFKIWMQLSQNYPMNLLRKRNKLIKHTLLLCWNLRSFISQNWSGYHQIRFVNYPTYANKSFPRLQRSPSQLFYDSFYTHLCIYCIYFRIIRALINCQAYIPLYMSSVWRILGVLLLNK